MHRSRMSCTVALLFTVCAVAPTAAQVTRTAQVPPLPSFAAVDSTSPSDSVLRKYIASVSFLTDHVSSDLRMLDAAHTGIFVRIDPAKGNHLVNASELKERGRIMARLVNPGMDPISRFALAPKGTTYIWFQYVHGTARVVLISADSTGAIFRRTPVGFRADSMDHPLEAKQSLARFSMDAAGTLAATCWPICTRGAWCKGDTTGTGVW